MEDKSRDEWEYRRYLRHRIQLRKRRRKVMIARAIVSVFAIVIVFFVFYGIGRLTGPIGGGSSTNEKKVETVESTATPVPVDIPEGYETIYQKIEQMKTNHPEVEDILLNIKQYPKNLLELLASNEETIPFVSDYLMHVDDVKGNGEITEEELQQKIPLFQQWDERWGYVKYGNDIIAIDGCGPTCMSMVYTGLTKKKDKTPVEIADFCIENNYYSTDAGTSWSFMSSGAKKLGLSVVQLGVAATSIKEKLKAGNPVICSMKPGDFTTTGHFIVLRGLSEDGKLLINDPNSSERSSKEWEMDTVLKQVKAVWAYSYTN